MSDLAEFLLARIAEDEAMAREAMCIPPGVGREVTLAGGSHGGPASDYPDIPLEDVGCWGWNGGPVQAESDPSDPLVRALGPIEADPLRPYRIVDSGLWDEGDPLGAEYYRATVPASAGRGTARHVARHDPARVLAECEAKRRIVKMAAVVDAMADAIDEEWGRGGDLYGDDLLRAIAQPYADHPDFREEWHD